MEMEISTEEFAHIYKYYNRLGLVCWYPDCRRDATWTKWMCNHTLWGLFYVISTMLSCQTMLFVILCPWSAPQVHPKYQQPKGLFLSHGIMANPRLPDMGRYPPTSGCTQPTKEYKEQTWKHVNWYAGCWNFRCVDTKFSQPRSCFFRISLGARNAVQPQMIWIGSHASRTVWL